jgi:hypothetical protein
MAPPSTSPDDRGPSPAGGGGGDVEPQAAPARSVAKRASDRAGRARSRACERAAVRAASGPNMGSNGTSLVVCRASHTTRAGPVNAGDADRRRRTARVHFSLPGAVPASLSRSRRRPALLGRLRLGACAGKARLARRGRRRGRRPREPGRVRCESDGARTAAARAHVRLDVPGRPRAPEGPAARAAARGARRAAVVHGRQSSAQWVTRRKNPAVRPVVALCRATVTGARRYSSRAPARASP